MFTAQVCPQCGGKLEKAEDYKYKCKFCSTLFEESKAEQFADVLNKFLDNEKQEKLANLKNLLWVELHEKKYIDSERILELTKDIMKIYPEDYIAGFFYTANNNEIASTADKIAKFDVRNYGYAVDWVLDFIIKSLEPSYVLPTSDLIERAFKNDDEKHKKYTSLLSQEAEKVEDGIYNLNMPRDVFVCYSSADMPKVVELVSTLEEEGISCFVAARNLRHGAGAVQNYQSALETAIEYCKIIVFVSSNNSRKLSCDAVKFELPYIRRRDLDKAPAEYAHDYEKMPAFYKKPRIEYLVDRYADRLSATDKQVKEFFSGNEWCLYSEDVRDRVVDILTNGWAKPIEVKDEAQNALAEEFARKLAEQQEKAKKEQEELLARQAQQLREMEERITKQTSAATFAQNDEKAALLEKLLQKEAEEQARQDAKRNVKGAEELIKRSAEEQSRQEIEEKRKEEEEAKREAERQRKAAEETQSKEETERNARIEEEYRKTEVEIGKKDEVINKLKLQVREETQKKTALENDKKNIENELSIRQSKLIKTSKIKAEIEEYSHRLDAKNAELEKLCKTLSASKNDLKAKEEERSVFIKKHVLIVENHYIYLGFYPQREVKDESIKAALNALAGILPTSNNARKWTSYGYYINKERQDYAWYIDLNYNDKKFRGVYFTEYRPSHTTSQRGEKRNGYLTNTVYWFAYEPIKWKILQNGKGEVLIASEMILDSQQYKGSEFNNDYALSDIRKWLNDTFYNVAFTPIQKEVIKSTTVDNSARSTSDKYGRIEQATKFACENTADKVFLLSEQEVTDNNYGFNTDPKEKDTARIKLSTDYTKSQGCLSYNGVSPWWLRSPLSFSSPWYARNVRSDGVSDNHDQVVRSDFGVVPAMKIEVLCEDKA